MILTQNQLDDYHQNGFLVIDHVLGDADLIPLEQEYEALLDDIARDLYQQGRIGSIYDETSFGDRYARVVAQCPDCVNRFNISLPLVNGKIDPETYVAHTGPGVFALLSSSKILDVVECVIGPEISSSPVQQMRIKPPQKNLGVESVAHSNLGITTWHQDIVAILPEADETNQVTVWVAVTDANEQNGCLVSIPRSHLEGPQLHVPGALAREPNIPASVISGRMGQPLPVQRGGIVLFHKQNIHSSLPNRSDDLRWSVDIRYHPTGQPSGRPAFPGFVARSQSNPKSVLKDPNEWQQMWRDARYRIIHGDYHGPIFKDWSDQPGHG